MNANDNNIDALLGYLNARSLARYHAALTALVAERNGLKQENDSLRSRCKVHQDEVLDRVFEMDALRKRIAELESHPPADRDRELREQLSAMEQELDALQQRVDDFDWGWEAARE
jgi:predicted  nucleic acid-binding Zn-ribbon protein